MRGPPFPASSSVPGNPRIPSCWASCVPRRAIRLPGCRTRSRTGVGGLRRPMPTRRSRSPATWLSTVRSCAVPRTCSTCWACRWKTRHACASSASTSATPWARLPRLPAWSTRTTGWPPASIAASTSRASSPVTTMRPCARCCSAAMAAGLPPGMSRLTMQTPGTHPRPTLIPARIPTRPLRPEMAARPPPASRATMLHVCPTSCWSMAARARSAVPARSSSRWGWTLACWWAWPRGKGARWGWRRWCSPMGASRSCWARNRPR